MIVASYIDDIGPEKARRYLDTNYELNRRIRNIWVKELAGMMRRGEFRSMNGQNPIIIGTDRKLYDGQHRLLAIIESGVTLPFEVKTTNTPIEDYATYDYASARKAADMVDVPNANRACAVARFMIGVEHGTVPLGSILIGRKDKETSASRTEITSFVNAHSERVVRITRDAARMYDSINLGGVAIYGLFIELVEFVHEDIFLNEFIDEFCSVATSNITILSAREAIRRAYTPKKKPNKSFILGTILCAYSHYKDSDDTNTLNKSKTFVDRYSKMMIEERDERNAHKQTDAA